MQEDNKKEIFKIFYEKISVHIKKDRILIQDLENNSSKQEYYKSIGIITYQIKILDYFCQISDKYFELFERRKNAITEDIRKEFYSIFKHASCFGTTITIEFSETAKSLDSLTELTPKRLFLLFSHLKKYYLKMNEYYGDDMKYVASTAKMYEELCGFALHVINFKKYFLDLKDMRHPNYMIMKNLVNFTIELLSNCADNYIETFHKTHIKSMVTSGISILETLEKYLYFSDEVQDIDLLSRKKETWLRLL